MQDFKSFAISHEFHLDTIELDGNVHRVNRRDNKNKTGWYIGKEFVSTKGMKYICATLGDWREPGLKLSYKPGIRLSREDNESIKQQQAINLKTVQELQEKIRSEAAAKSSQQWESASQVGDHPYLKRKLMSEPIGLKQLGDTLLVPCRDVNGTIHGFQKIFPDGKKIFVKGQRTKGMFHTLGDIADSDIVYIAEGIATAYSIFIATGAPTVCAMSAHNLIEVAKELKNKYAKTFIICGDDDRFNQINAGREAATKAAEKLGTTPLFPTFRDKVKKLTDFNDLHVEEGIDAVKAQLVTEFEDKPFTALGYCGGSHFFFTQKGKSIFKINQFSEKELFELRPLDHWKTMYSKENGQVDWPQIKSDLIDVSTSAGVFDSSKIRGCGVWNDNGRLVVNTGDNFIVNEKIEERIKSNYFYVQTRQAIPPLQQPATSEELKPLLEFLSLVKFQNKADWKLVAGWLAIARIAGAMPVRPHIWLTGGRGTGKSSIFEKAINPILGKSKVYASGAGSTEAGIRQLLSADAVPVIIDEFEINNKHSENIDGILGLMRQAWSAGDAKIYKGSATGQAMEYSLAFCALVASIRVGVVNDADRGRICILELVNHGSVDSEWKAMEAITRKITEQLGERLFSRSVAMSATILNSFETARSAITGAAEDSRTGQQYGMLIAGYHSLVSDIEITATDALELFSEIRPREIREADDNERDESELFDYLMNTKIDIRDGHREIFQDSVKGHLLNGRAEYLQTYGFWRCDSFLYIRDKHPELTKILKDTRWYKNWGRTLGRLPGATARKEYKPIGEKTMRTTKIPISHI